MQNTELQLFIDRLPLLSPMEISDELERLGYKGQDEQRRILSLMAYRHIRRLKRLYLEGEYHRNLPPKQNILMVGPTGCGKTFIVELLFQHIFKLPTVIVDITSFSESGYVGDDARSILTRLIHAAGGNPWLASCGVVCIDEFDKLASSNSSARFAGQGTTKDVSGYGVQRELLAMLEGTDIIVPMDYGFSAYGERAELSTRDISFIACGAFSGIDDLLQASQANIGFFAGKEKGNSDKLGLEKAALFQKYGFLPELVGRFSRIIQFPPLSPEILQKILTENILPQFQNEFRGEDIELTITDDALSHIIMCSKNRETGARGLQNELLAAVEQAAFETFMRISDVEVKIALSEGQLVSEICKLSNKQRNLGI